MFGTGEWIGTAREAFEDRRVRRFWAFGLVAVVLHGVLDPLITYLAVVVFGVGRETSPWMAAALRQGVGVFIAVHLPLYVACLSLLSGWTWLFVRASPSEAAQLYRLSRLGWVVIILWGGLLVGNNLLVLLGGL